MWERVGEIQGERRQSVQEGHSTRVIFGYNIRTAGAHPSNMSVRDLLSEEYTEVVLEFLGATRVGGLMFRAAQQSAFSSRIERRGAMGP